MLLRMQGRIEILVASGKIELANEIKVLFMFGDSLQYGYRLHDRACLCHTLKGETRWMETHEMSCVRVLKSA